MNNQPTEFDGRCAVMRKSPWLASEDIDGLGDVPATISHVFRYDNVEFEAGRKEKAVFAIAFDGKDRQLVLNGVNRRTLRDAFGATVSDWKGKKIKLYVDNKVRMMGKQTKGIRIKI